VQHLELDGAPDLVAGENADEVICTGDRDPVERQNDVAGVESRPFGRTRRLDAGDHHRTLLGQACRMPSPPRKRELLGRDADIGAAHPTVAHQLAQHEAGGVGGNGEADTLRAHDQCSVDADDLAVGGDERAS
jgi:hypothetical protein